MKIKFNNYKNGLHQFNFVKDVEELNLDDKFIGNVLLNCVMDKSSNQIVLNCDLSLTAKQICDRCTAEFEEEFNTEFKVIYFITHDKDNSVEDESGIYYLSPDDDNIDLSRDVFENALLILPMKILCKEDCKGICPICGGNKNEVECNCVSESVNPVWEPLLKLKGKLN